MVSIHVQASALYSSLHQIFSCFPATPLTHSQFPSPGVLNLSQFPLCPFAWDSFLFCLTILSRDDMYLLRSQNTFCDLQTD